MLFKEWLKVREANKIDWSSATMDPVKNMDTTVNPVTTRHPDDQTILHNFQQLIDKLGPDHQEVKNFYLFNMTKRPQIMQQVRKIVANAQKSFKL